MAPQGLRLLRRFGFVLLISLPAAPLCAQTVLNFPRVITSAQSFTGLSVVNPTTAEVPVTFSAFQPDGSSFKTPVTVTIPAGGQHVRSFAEVFSATEPFNGWVQATSSASGLVGFFLNANSASTDIDGSAAIEPGGESLLPIAVEDGTAKTEITLANANSEIATVSLTLYATDGSVIASREVPLNGHALLRQTLLSIFGSADYSRSSHVRVRSDRPVIGYEVVADFQIPQTANRRETMAVPGQAPSAALVYGVPQFVAGTEWTSYLSVVNGSGIGQELTITAYKDDGTSIAKRLSLSGNASLKTTVGELFGFPADRLTTGWIEVRGTLGYLVASIGFGNVQTPSFSLVPGLDVSRALRTGVYAQVAEGASFFSGATLVNAGTQKADIEFFTLRSDGTTVGKGIFTIAPGQRLGKLFRELVPASLEQSSGWAFLRSSQPVFGAGLFGPSNGFALMNLPEQAGSAAFTPPAQTTAAISGAVTQESGGVSQITMTLSGPVNATRVTDASGNYSFTQLPAGDYKVSLNKQGATFFPTERTVTLGKTNVDGVNFQAVGISPAEVPGISFLTPASTFGGNAAFNVTVLGGGFNPASVVQINGQALQTLYVNSTELRAVVPSALLARPAVLNVSVLTPPPGGGTSNRIEFTVNQIPSNPLIEGRLSVGSFPAGVAIHPVRKIALITNQTDDNIHIVDLKDLRKIGEIKVGRSPAEGIAIDATRNRALVANVGSNDVWIIDLSTNTVTAKVPVGNFPLGIAYSAVTDRAVVANGQSGTVSIIDVTAAKVVGQITVGTRPDGVAINPVTNQALVTNSVSNNVSVLDLNTNQSIDTIPVGQYPRGVAINYATRTAVVANANSNDISIIDLVTRKVTSTLKVGTGPTGVAIHLATNSLVVTNSGRTRTSNAAGAVMTATVINLDTREVVSEVPVGAEPYGVDVDTDIQRAVVVNYSSNDITVIRLPNPKPRVSDIEPKTFPAGGGAVTITVHGTGFLPTSVVTLNGRALATTFVSSTELRAEIPADLLQQLLERRTIESAEAKPGSFRQVVPLNFDIGVSNPGPGGGDSPPPSNPQSNQIQPQNAQPVLTSISPTRAEAGPNGVDITLSGNNFNGTSIINFGAGAHSPSTVTATSMTVHIAASEMQPGVVSVSITNPPPGGGTSGSMSFTITDRANPVPTISSVAPAEVAAGAAGVSVTISGSGFGAFTSVSLQGQSASASVAAGSITLSIPASLLTEPRSLSGLVTNAGPGGGTASFTVNVLNPAPSISGFSPTTVAAGSASFDLRVTGSRFGPSSTITLEGTPVPTQFVSSSELRTSVPDVFLRRAGLVKVGVSNPSPGGGLAEGGTLSITSPKPELTSISPASAPVGAVPFPIQLTGSGFLGNSTVLAGNQAIPSLFESSTSLSATIPGALLARGGTLSIRVSNPEPGGGVSGAVDLAVQNGLPALESISPTSLKADQKDVTLELVGRNFVEGSKVVMAEIDLATTFISATRLKAALPAVIPFGRVPITVRNPLPGGGVSNVVEITVTALAPVITEVRPTTIGVGQVLTIVGLNFARGSAVSIGGVKAATSVISDKELSAVVPLDLPIGPSRVVVTNPEPGGGTSNEVTVQVTNVAPVITGLDPSTILVNQAPATITIAGRAFSARSIVQLEGQAVASTFVDETTIRFVVPTQTATGVFTVTVSNPGVSGGVSGPAKLTVVNPAPSVTSIDPAAAPALTTVSIRVSGSNFVRTSVVTFGGAPVPTTFVDSSALSASINLSLAGVQPVAVTNPAPGGGVSNSVNFVTSAALNPVPSISEILPAVVQAGVASNVQIQGANFTGGASVSLDGSGIGSRVVVSANVITVSLPPLSAGSHSINVQNPGPGGGNSNTAVLIAANRPAIASLTPNLVAPGSGAFTATIAGSNFAAGSAVLAGGTVLKPSSITPVQIVVTIPASVVAAEGNVSVSVVSQSLNSTPMNLGVRNVETYVTGLNAPNDIVVNGAGDLFIANGGTGSVLKVTSAGAITTAAAGFSVGTKSNAVTRGGPAGLALSSTGDLFVADNAAGTVTRVSGTTATLFASGFTRPTDIAFDNAGNLLVANGTTGVISKVTPAGQKTTLASVSGEPAGLAVDGAGFVYVTEFRSGTVYRISPDGGALSALGVMPRLSDALSIDAEGKVFVASGARSAIYRMESTGLVAKVSDDVSGGPAALTFDSAGLMFAASNAQDKVFRFPSRVSSLPQAKPFVARMEPAFAVPGAGLSATLSGSGLSNATAVTFSNNQITASIQPGGTAISIPVNVMVSGAAPVSSATFTVTTPAGVSNVADFDIVGTPGVSQLVPATTTAGSDDFTLTIHGSNFQRDAFVNFGSTPLTPSSVTATQISVSIPTAAVSEIGTAIVNVSSASATSNSLNFDIRTPVVSIEITPNAFNPTALGVTRQFTAVAKNEFGNVIANKAIRWTSSTASVLTINDATGLAIVNGNGVADITAVVDGVSASIPVAVQQAVAAVVVAPSPTTMSSVGDTRQFSATVRDSNGVTISGKAVEWKSSTPATASVDGTGLAAALANGTTTIDASVDGVAGSAVLTVDQSVSSVEVSPAVATLASLNVTQSFTVVAKDSRGNVIHGKTVTWSSTAAGVASVGASGIATSIANGTTTIRAGVDGITGSAALTVAQAIASVDVQAGTAGSLASLGDTRQFTAVPKDANGQAVSGKAVSWASENATVVSVNASGLAAATGNGTTRVRATVEGVSGAADITVAQAVASIDVTPGTKTLTSLTDSQQFAANPKDARGNSVPGKTVTWSSASEAVATVDSSGRATAVANGDVAIRATVDGISATATLTVSQVAAKVTIVPATFTLSALTDSKPFTVTLKDARDNAVNKAVVWTSETPSVATIDANGVATSAANGTAVIRAAVDGVSGTATLTVAQAAATVEVTPATKTLVSLGDTQQFSATVKDAKGVVVAGKTINWASDTSSVATISSLGVATSVTNGTSAIRATVEGVSGTASLTVAQAVAAIEVSPPTRTLNALNDTQQFAATVRDAKGNAIAGKTISWTSLTPAVASVSDSGVVTALANGSSTIRAAVDGVTGSASLTVDQTAATVEVSPSTATITAVTDTRAFTVTPKDSRGNSITGKTATWSVSDAAIASIGATGVATAAANGTTTVRATVDGVTGAASLTVAQAAATVEVTPATKTLVSLNDTQQFTATVKDAKGVAISGKTIAWSSEAASVATIGSTGLATSLINGTSTIRATVEGVSGTGVLTVAQAVSSVEVTPAAKTLSALNTTQQFSATVKDARGNAIAGKTISWASLTPAVASISESGIATTVANGSTTIRATVDGIAGTAVLTVTQTAATVELSPDNVTIVAITETAAFTATVKDSQGNVIAGRTLTWTSDDVAVATVSAAGVATAVGPGSTLIRAAVDGVSGTARVVVNQAVDTLEIDIESSGVATVDYHVAQPNVIIYGLSAPITLTSLGQTQKFVVAVRDRKGRSIPNRTAVWTSDASTVATITSGGLASAIGNGTTVIRVTVEGKTASVNLTVAQAVASIEVTPAPASIDALGGTKQFSATVKDARNNSIAGKTLTWASSQASVATVDANGLATALASGNAQISASVDGKTGAATLAIGQAVATVTVSPSNATINSLGGTRQFTATAKDPKGNVIPGKTATWSSGTPAVATVSSNGLASALTNGQTVITATIDGVSDTARLRVSQGASLMEVTPDSATLSAKNRQQVFTATVRDENGNAIAGQVFTWTSSNTAVATINGTTGVAAAVDSGTTTITATNGTLTTTATLRVARNVSSVSIGADGSGTIPALQRKRKYTAVAKDEDGYTIDGKAVTWTSLTTGLADINATGEATARGNGRARLRAAIDGVVSDVDLDIDQQLNRVDIESPESGKIRAKNRKRQFNAVAKDPDGNPIAGRTATWQSLSTATAEIDSSGVATAKGNGVVTLRATIGGVVGETSLDVDQEVSRIEMTADGAGSIPALNRKRRFTARAIDPDGYEITGKTVAWTSSDTGKATVDANGEATAKGNGRAKVRATIDGVTGESDLDVSQASSSIQIDADGSGSIPALNRKRRFTARVKDPDGNDIAGKTVNWASLTTGLADVGADGEATARGNGRARIRATVDGLSADVDMDIAQVLNRVDITTAEAGKVRALNRRRQYTAKAKDPDGNEISGKTAVWSSESNAVAEIDNSGTATAKGNGVVKVRATIDGVVGEASIDIDQLVDRVDLTADGSGSIPALNRKRRFTATAKDPDGYPVTGKAVTWSSSDTGKATVDNSGEATAKGNGRSKIRATIDGVAAETDLDVSQLTSTIGIDADSAGAIPALGRKRRFTARVKDPDGFEIAGKTVNWASLTTGLADIGSDGQATAKGNGRAKLRATVDGISADVDMDVEQQLQRVDVTTAETGKVRALNRRRQFTAIAKDPDGNPISGKTATWTTESSAIAQIDNSGIATAKGNGSVRMRATIEGVAGETTLEIEQSVDRVEVNSTATGSIPALNRKRQFTAVAKDPDGYVVSGKTPSWTSSDSEKADVAPNGEATAKANGRAKVRATIDGVTGEADIDVTQVTTTVEVSATGSGSIPALNRKRKFTAKAKDPDGNEIAGKTATWSALSPDVADVDSTGEVTAKGNGRSKIRATIDGVTAESDFDVSQVTGSVEVTSTGSGSIPALNRKRQYSAVARDADGFVIAGKNPAWGSSASGIADVSPSGETTAKGNGKAKVRATIDGVTGETEIEIQQTTSSIAVSSTQTGSIPALNRKRQFSAVVKDPDGNPIAGKTIAWSSSAPDIADVSPSGEAAAKGNGRARVRATVDGVTGENDLDIAQVVTQMTVSSSESGTIKALYRTRQFSAVAKDADGNPVAGKTAAWSSSSGSVAEVDSNGRATSKKKGRTAITATVDGVSVSADLDVDQEVAVVTINPATATVSLRGAGTKKAFEATIKDEDGNLIDDKEVTWSTGDDKIATISSKGVADGKKAGTVTIRADVDGKRGTALLVVSP